MCAIGAVSSGLISYMGDPGLCPRSGIQTFMVRFFHVVYIVGTSCDPVLITARLVCAQLPTREIRGATTFTTRSHVTLDVMQRHSRDYYSLSSLGSAAVLHVTTWKSTIIRNGTIVSAHAHVLLHTI